MADQNKMDEGMANGQESVEIQPPQNDSNENNEKSPATDTDEILKITDLTPLNADEKNENILSNIKSLMDQLKLNSNLINRSAKVPADAKHKPYKFWSTQPVPKLDELVQVNEAVEKNKQIADIHPVPYSLPDGFQWDNIDLEDEKSLNELYTLLNENYVEDNEAMFRFDYQPDFLKWALQSPGWRKDWHVGVRVTKSERLVGFISAIPSTIRVYNQSERMAEINFLCVHKKLRSKRVAPVLIREITRRVNLTGVFQAVYTAGVVLPKPIVTCRYWHRSINPRKLVDVKFSHLARNMTMQRMIKLYKLPEQTKTKGFRRMEAKDVPKAHKLLNAYISKFNLAPIFSEDEFRHWFTPKNNVMESYVVADEKGVITDMVSFYNLPSTVMHHPQHKQIKAAYSFYNVSTKTPWKELMNDALIVAKKSNYDVFNALDLMDNEEFLSALKFGVGDGDLYYYLYNWKCPSMTPADTGIILL